MSGVTNALNLAKAGLLTGQKALEVAGNNIANVNTPGYSREVPVFSEFPTVMIQGVVIGTGAGIRMINREHDVFLARQIQDKNAFLGAENGKTAPLAEVERIVDISDAGLAASIDRFFGAWQELSGSPGDRVAREAVLDSGSRLAAAFAAPIDQLQAEQRNIDITLGARVTELNAKFKEVAELNQTIAGIESGGPSALSARDRRDVLLQEISYALGGRSYESPESGMVSYYLPNGLPLLQDGSAYSLELVTGTGVQDLQLNIGSQQVTLDRNKVGGEINGLLTVRDQVIPDLIADLDKLAFTLANEVNAVHQLGMGRDGVSGRDFFVPPVAQTGSAGNLALSLSDYTQVAAGLTDAPGDNRNSLAITALGGALLIDGDSTFSGYYGRLATSIGVDVSTNKVAAKGTQDSLDLLNNMRDNTVGVSVEEEMVSLIRYQKAFEASAKYLSVVNDMLDVLVNVGG